MPDTPAVIFPSKDQPRYHTALVACARWEAQYIEEWVLYYKIIGYDHLYIYCNDDNPTVLYEKLQPHIVGRDPFITFIYFEWSGLQYQMYMHFILNHSKDAAWVSFFDIDEFLRLPSEQSITDFLNIFEDRVDCILFNWVVFGTSHHKTAPSGKVLENYTLTDGNVNHFTKFIMKSCFLRDPKLLEPESAFGFWHNPYQKTESRPLIVDVLMQEFGTEEYSYSALKDCKNIAVLHHYLMKSEDYASHRVARGITGAFSEQSIWDTSTDAGRSSLENLKRFNAMTDLSLANFWKSQASQAVHMTVTPSVKGTLLSAGKSCDQSSISAWSKGKTTQEDAAGAINGIIDGREKFHTGLDPNPWWRIDLGRTQAINHVIIYNTSYNARSRFRNFILFSSEETDDWKKVFDKTDDKIVGGLLTHPFVVTFDPPLRARSIMILMANMNYLHLDQVQIFGEDLS